MLVSKAVNNCGRKVRERETETLAFSVSFSSGHFSNSKIMTKKLRNKMVFLKLQALGGNWEFKVHQEEVAMVNHWA